MNTRKKILSPREIEVLKLLMQENDAERIAAILKCKIATVKTHIRNIHSKLSVSTTIKAIFWGIRNKVDEW